MCTRASVASLPVSPCIGWAGLCLHWRGLLAEACALCRRQGEWLQSTFIGDHLACSAMDTEVRTRLACIACVARGGGGHSTRVERGVSQKRNVPTTLCRHRFEYGTHTERAGACAPVHRVQMSVVVAKTAAEEARQLLLKPLQDQVRAAHRATGVKPGRTTPTTAAKATIPTTSIHISKIISASWCQSCWCQSPFAFAANPPNGTCFAFWPNRKYCQHYRQQHGLNRIGHNNSHQQLLA